MPQLRLHSPAFIQGLGSTLALNGDDMSIGRGADNDVVIPECTVALKHARLQRTDAGWLLTDLPDTNGIWIGIRRVSEHVLTPGQLFRIGGVALEFIPDGEASALVVDPHPDRTETAHEPLADHDSGMRAAEPAQPSEPTEVNPPDWQMPSEPEQTKAPEPSTPASKKPQRSSALRWVPILLTLVVIGAGLTFGADAALRWLNQAYSGPRKLPKFATTAVSHAAIAEPAPKPQQVTLVDKAIDALGAEQDADVPGILNLKLPADALKKPTHLVVARAANSGWTFCAATRFADAAYEIATASNAVWTRPASLELAVDVDQLAKTQVPAVAIGFRDSADEQWALLPTEYDSVHKLARAQMQQPGVVALFYVKAPEYYAASEHFALLFEPAQGADPSASHQEHPEAALRQLEAALGNYRKLGYRIANGTLWVCAARSSPAKAAALLPVFARRELERQHSHALARAAFAALVPGYVGPHSIAGREFWFAALLEAIAAEATGVRVTSSQPSFKRLATSLIADDWPWSPLFVSLIPRLLDKQANLFRLWNDTTHVMVDLDAKSVSDLQSPALAVDMAIQAIANKSLLDLYYGYVNERLLAEHGLALDALRSHEVCTHVTQLTVDNRGSTVALEVPKAFTVRWACVVIDVKSGMTRSVHFRLANDAPPSVSFRLLRLNSGQVVEPPLTAAQATRFDLTSSEVFILSAANPSLTQVESLNLRVDDVSIATSIVPSETATARTSQTLASTLNLMGIPEELKTVSVEWDFGDGTPKTRSEWTPNANRSLRIDQTHAWVKEGSFILRASVYDPQEPTRELSFASRSITVQALRVEVTASGAHLQPGADVQVRAKITGPALESLSYRFNFGDATSPTVSSAPEVTHQFNSAGEYTIVVEALAGAASNEVLASGKTVLSIRAAEPAPSSSLTPQPASPAASGQPAQ